MSRPYFRTLVSLHALLTLLFLTILTIQPALGAVEFKNWSQSPGASSTTCVITKPTDLAVNDLMIAHVVFADSAGATITPPSGWTQIQFYNTNKPATSMWWKIATSSDVAAASFTFTSSGSDAPNIGAISTWTGYNSAAPISASSSQWTANDYTITAPSITPVANSMILMGASIDNNYNTKSYTIATSPPTFTERYDIVTTAGADAAVAMASGLRPESTATGTGTASLGIDSDDNVGFLVAIAPPTWDSYNDSPHNNLDDDFTTSDTVYMHGTGFVAGYSYQVAYYVGNTYHSSDAGVIATSAGNLSTDEPTDLEGTWHVQVFNNSISPPSTYDANNADALADDSFTVSLAVPEFPAGTILPFAASLILYAYMRRKAKNGKK